MIRQFIVVIVVARASRRVNPDEQLNVERRSDTWIFVAMKNDGNHRRVGDTFQF